MVMSPQDPVGREQQAATSDHLRSELNQAREAFEVAKDAFDTALGMAHKLGLDTSDGAHALYSAIKDYNHALGQYSGAVKRFADFLLKRALTTVDAAPKSAITVHAPDTGHFKCQCGVRLAFGTERSAMTPLMDQRRVGSRKFGTCPKCGHSHVVPIGPY